MDLLDEAVRARMAKECPDQPVMAWVLIAATLPAGEETDHDLTVLAAPGQPAYASAGLIALSTRNVRSGDG